MQKHKQTAFNSTAKHTDTDPGASLVFSGDEAGGGEVMGVDDRRQSMFAN